MKKEWKPSLLGRKLTRSTDWRLRLDGLELSLTTDGHTHMVNVEEETAYRIHSGMLWTDITLFPGQVREIRADGLPNGYGKSLTNALNAALAPKRIREDVELLRNTHRAISNWLEHKANQEQTAIQTRRWFTHEMQEAILGARPSIDLGIIRARLNNPVVAIRLGHEALALEKSLSIFENDPRATWQALNAAHTEREMEACRDLLERVENKPLTEEQARAVICFDSRVQVVAAAGSGKTSTMVAKAAYAIHRGFVSPEQVVLLAFNKQAADELKARVARSFNRLGMGGVPVQASTFHALGLAIIGKATGQKPDIPEWAIERESGLHKLAEIVGELKEKSPIFRAKWDLFRFVCAKDLPALGAQGSADVWDARGNALLRTARGDSVKSQEEAMIANWLFYNGVEYRYEPSYKHRTADEEHRQYRPDFYYPKVDLYHEHFALDARGQPPAHFKDYLDGVNWKRRLHHEKGTSLFETTSNGLRNGNDFQRLEAELISRGVVLDPNPDREIPQYGQRPMESAELIALVRTFISHAKSNCLSTDSLHQRLEAIATGAFKYRHRMFVDIAMAIMEAWDTALALEDGIDFEDMLNLAAEHLERGRYVPPFELVMVDEFQDASRARARLCRALVQKPGRFLFAVGDDWQSVNRFAGADVTIMTGFRQWFGHGEVLKLEQTFRCPQALCNVSSRFIGKNPAQITKQVNSVAQSKGPVFQAFQVDGKGKLADAIDQFVVRLADEVQNGTAPPGRNGKVAVYVLGRYNADRQYLPLLPSRLERFVDVTFLTIHRAKGSEADYVILPAMLSQLSGRSFPDTRSDDSVLTLAMPDGDNYPLSEERRLFYVALTRARRSVAMFTVRGQCSSFLRELEADGAVVITDTDGEALHEEYCPVCRGGVLVWRTGRYGEFRSCSNFPACAYKPRKSRA